MSDKRNKQRKPSFLGGTISYNNDLWSADCVVKNLSDTGAKLTGRNLPALLPDRFDLTIPQRKMKYRVHVRWRSGDQIGVLFEQIYSNEGAQVQVLQSPAKIAARLIAANFDDDVKPLPISSDNAL